MWSGRGLAACLGWWQALWGQLLSAGGAQQVPLDGPSPLQGSCHLATLSQGTEALHRIYKITNMIRKARLDHRIAKILQKTSNVL